MENLWITYAITDVDLRPERLTIATTPAFHDYKSFLPERNAFLLEFDRPDVPAET